MLGSEAFSTLFENVLGELVAHLLEAMWRHGRRRDERELARWGAVGKRLSRELIEIGRMQRPDLSEQDWQAALLWLRACLAAAAPLDVALALESGLDPDALKRILGSKGAQVNDDLLLTDESRQAFEWLVNEASTSLMLALTRQPGFDQKLAEATFRELLVVCAALEKLPAQIEMAGYQDSSGDFVVFEHRYLEYVAELLGSFELFGVNRGREPSRQSFNESYVSVTVARTSAPELDAAIEDELTGAGVSVANALTGSRRVILRGGAGSGKTTLLHWLAANGAAGRLTGESGPWGEVVPFLVHLREFADRRLPLVEELPAIAAAALEGERPAGWATSCFAAGRALLLVDGVDELVIERRQEVRDWIEQLVAAYPESRYVVTVRPFAVPHQWLSQGGHRFDGFDLLPLSAKGIRDFLDRWHEAAKAGQNEARRAWLDECREGLAVLMPDRPELRRLATSPLLCGLLCALYQDRDMELPRDRKTLLSAALELLLFRWNEHRGFPANSDAVPSREEQTILLQRFAYSMVKNQNLVVTQEAAAARIAHALRGMRSQQTDPGSVLRYVLERTGLFQEPRSGQIQFVHRTFRDYLAAKEVVESGDLDFLVEQAHHDQWHEVVIMAVAHARPGERAALMRALLGGNTAAHRDHRVADRLHLLAAASLEQADVLDDNEIRRSVQEAAARLIPPTSPLEASMLALAGGFVLDLLPGPEGLDEHQMAHVVHTIAMIGGPESLARIQPYAAVNTSLVINELLQAWRLSQDPEAYAEHVLSGVEYGDREVQVQGWHKVVLLRYLVRLHNLHVPGDLTPLDPLTEIPHLQKLTLSQNFVLRDLSPLSKANSPDLRALRLVTCPRIVSLSPLADSAVEELELYMMPNADLQSMAGLDIKSLAIRDDRLRKGLSALPGALLKLTSLTIDNLPDRRSLLGIARWGTLEHVSVHGMPDPEETAELAELTHLRTLQIRDSPGDASPEIAALRARLRPVTVECI